MKNKVLKVSYLPENFGNLLILFLRDTPLELEGVYYLTSLN